MIVTSFVRVFLLKQVSIFIQGWDFSTQLHKFERDYVVLLVMQLITDICIAFIV